MSIAGSVAHRKRQRRQAAALVVSSFFNMGKKSTAQPRPKLNVPPRGIGPIDEPNENDVLCGRGGRINAHEGNIRFRDVINANKREYLAKTTKKLEKAHIAKRIVDEIRSKVPSGRFLKEDPNDGYWYDIGDAKAIKKAGQALREDAPGIRTELDHDSSGEEGEETSPKPKAPTSKAPPSKAPAPAPVTPAPPGPSSFGNGPGHSGANFAQREGQWSATGSAPREYAAPVSEEAPAYHPYPGNHPSQYQQAHPYETLYNGLRPGANRSGGLSQRASEAMKQASPSARAVSEGGVPQNMFAFGRQFTPTVMSSGSTMSTISGLSSGMGTESLTHSGSGQQRLSGRDHSLRVSQLSDMSSSLLSISGGASFHLSRSSSLPDLDLSGQGRSLSDASFAMLMQEKVDGSSSQTGSDLRDSSGTSGSSGNRPPGVPGPQPRTRTTSTASAVSAMSWTSGGSRGSKGSIRSMGSDTSWLAPYRSKMADWDHESSRSVMSDVSADVLALDLADPRM